MNWFPVFLIKYFTGEQPGSNGATIIQDDPGKYLSVFGLILIIIFTSIIFKKWQ